MPITWPAYQAPPAPAATADAATWANYLAHVRIQDDRLRFDAQQVTAGLSTDAQNARAAAEQAVAEAGKAQAEANVKHAEALQAMAAAMGKEVQLGIDQATLLEALRIVRQDGP